MQQPSEGRRGRGSPNTKASPCGQLTWVLSASSKSRLDTHTSGLHPQCARLPACCCYTVCTWPDFVDKTGQLTTTADCTNTKYGETCERDCKDGFLARQIVGNQLVPASQASATCDDGSWNVSTSCIKGELREQHRRVNHTDSCQPTSGPHPSRPVLLAAVSLYTACPNSFLVDEATTSLPNCSDPALFAICTAQCKDGYVGGVSAQCTKMKPQELQVGRCCRVTHASRVGGKLAP